MKGIIKMANQLTRWLAALAIMSLTLILIKDQSVGAKMAVMTSICIAYFVAIVQNKIEDKK